MVVCTIVFLFRSLLGDGGEAQVDSFLHCSHCYSTVVEGR